MRNWLMVLSLLFMVSASSIASGASTPASLGLSASDVQAIRHSADYILGCRMSNGFLPMNMQQDIWGITSFATASATGLLRAYQVTGDARYLKAVLGYADWYAEHINPDGTMYDWAGTRDTPVPTHDYDSTDAYTAEFIVLCYETTLVTHDQAWLKAKYPAIVQSVNGMLLTWQSDGLTYAKPTYKVKYLMDNLEVRLGLRAAAKIAQMLHTSDVGKWSALLEENRLGLKKLFLANEGRFAVAIFEDGNIDKDFAKWYPDGMANALALACILDKRDPRALGIYRQLNAKFSDGDYYRLIAACKFGSKEEAGRVRSKLSVPEQCLDHSNYIRSFVPELDAFSYQGEWLALPGLAPGRR